LLPARQHCRKRRERFAFVMKDAERAYAAFAKAPAFWS